MPRARLVSHPTLGPLGQPEKAMGHESPIEPWLAPDNRAACGSPNRLASSRKRDENHWQGKPNPLRNCAQRPESTERKAKTILLHEVGWKARNHPAVEEVFFS